MSQPAEIPKQIGKYEIASKIGEGGFGIVYKGRDPFIKRTVAVKTCTSDQDMVRKRFFREAEISGNLRHDNVITIHDFGVHEDTPFLVQEFLTGEDLDVLIKGNFDNLDTAFKVRCLREVAEGLRYAHQQGVIHRDIKPANIRVLQSGRIKVMDFGIARLKDQQTQLTKTGMTLGTVSYLSPEQLRGDEVDHRVDVFSYGVLAFELFAGRKPFTAKSISNLFYKLLHDDAPTLDTPGLPAGMSALVKKCLEKNADDRYQSFDQIIEELHEIQVTGGMLGESGEFPGQGLPDVADTVREAIKAGELTAAEFSLSHARKQMSDSDEFDRRFGALQRQLESAKSGSEPSAAPDETRLAQIERRIEAGEYENAERELIAISQGLRGNARVDGLWQRLRDARTGSAGELPIHPDVAPTTGVWWQSRNAQYGAIALAALIVTLLIFAWLSGDGDEAPAEAAAPATAGAAGGPAAATDAADPQAANTSGIPATPAPAPESDILVPVEPAPADDLGRLEEWSGDSEAASTKPPPIEEFSGDGS